MKWGLGDPGKLGIDSEIVSDKSIGFILRG
jgi:hypothetical protein